MSTKIPFAKEVAVIRTRLSSTLKDTAEKHNLTQLTVSRIMERNSELIERIKEQILEDTRRTSE